MKLRIIQKAKNVYKIQRTIIPFVWVNARDYFESRGRKLNVDLPDCFDKTWYYSFSEYKQAVIMYEHYIKLSAMKSKIKVMREIDLTNKADVFVEVL